MEGGSYAGKFVVLTPSTARAPNRQDGPRDGRLGRYPDGEPRPRMGAVLVRFQGANRHPGPVSSP